MDHGAHAVTDIHTYRDRGAVPCHSVGISEHMVGWVRLYIAFFQMVTTRCTGTKVTYRAIDRDLTCPMASGMVG